MHILCTFYCRSNIVQIFFSVLILYFISSILFFLEGGGHVRMDLENSFSDTNAVN